MALRRVVVLAMAGALVAACSAAPAKDIKVTLEEWKITLSPANPAAGEVTFTINNKGEKDHEFVVVKTDLAPDALPTVAEGEEAGTVDEEGAGITSVDELEDIKAGTDNSVLKVTAWPRATTSSSATFTTRTSSTTRRECTPSSRSAGRTAHSGDESPASPLDRRCGLGGPLRVGAVLVAGIQIIPVIASREAEIENSAFVLLTVLSVPVLMFVVVGLAYSALRFRAAGDEADGPPIHGHAGLPGGLARRQLRACARSLRLRRRGPARHPRRPERRLRGQGPRRAVGLALRVPVCRRRIEGAAHSGR